MILTKEKSLCKEKQKEIVSKEHGREHHALNKKHAYSVRQYRLDGGLFRQEKCCDYLVLNDSKKNAYFLELKGRNVSDAVEQLEAGRKKVIEELSGYELYYRIIGSKMRTHELDTPKMRKLKEKYKGKLVYKSVKYEEEL